MIGGMGSDRHFAWQQSSGSNVRFGSKADIGANPFNVALPPKADIVQHDRDVRFVPKADIHSVWQRSRIVPPVPPDGRGSRADAWQYVWWISA